MSITREEVLQIATLARLRLTDSESEDLSHDLSQILEYVDTLASVQVPEGERFELGTVGGAGTRSRPDPTRPDGESAH